MLVTRRESKAGSTYEANRLKFIGRGRTLRDPVALDRARGLSGTVGATLDPCLALGQAIELKPHASVQLVYLTIAQHSREQVLNLAQRYRSWLIIEQAFDRARAQSELALRQLMLSSAELQRYQQLLSLLLYPTARLRSEPALLAANTKGQSGLWAYGISGDYPLVLVQVADEMEAGTVLELLQAHAYWRTRQIKIDLVILNVRESGYAQQVENRVQRLLAQTHSERWLYRRGGIFVLNAQQLNEADRTLLYTTARAVVRGGTPLSDQLAHASDRAVQLPAFVPALSDRADSEPTPVLSRPTDLLFDNELGGFTADGREYVIYLKNAQRTPLPWINVIANPEFGSLVSEAGGGYTWAVNSGENRLTPWRNDPVSDQPGEALYLRDEETALIWSPTPLPAGEAEPYLVRHGAGYSIFEHHSHGLKQQLTVFVAPDAPVKIVWLRLENTWGRMRRITATYYAEWVLGVSRDNMQAYVIPEYHDDSHALLARNPYNTEFGERVAFLAASQPQHGLTADRTEFLGRLGGYESPAALNLIGLAGRVAPGSDPCAAIMLHLDLPPGDGKEIYFLLGQGADRTEALHVIKRFQNAEEVEQAWLAARQQWDELLNTIEVRTPDRALDVLLNRWLLYQALSCRLWARAALYQSSGAYGFRDQLQDVLALIHAAPQLACAHILEAARHQFEAGDVLHWWHPPSRRGLRTRCSDDLLWLPYVTAQYVAATGDRAILAEEAPFLRALPLEPEEEERYGQYEATSETYTLYEHCRRALKKGATSGAHRLPLIGAGDWNDGMNRVGSQGQGESVWLGWFLYDCLMQFAPLCEMMDDQRQATLYRQQARNLQQALEDQAWDGAWYRRAFYDDGSPLGSVQNRECQIDSIAQSWAVISRGAQPDRARQAMEAVAQRLVREDAALILLFTPPFDQTKRDPGYIKGYLPGIRENGGQYTHAALWATWAFAQLGQGNRAGHLFQLLNPIYHGRTPGEVHVYQTEPYVIAADVYSVPPHQGRGGWTWYTGSASWMYRLGLEAILGVQREGDRLCLNPCIPADWPGYEVTYHFGASRYEIHVRNPAGVEHGVRHLRLDGRLLPDGSIPLIDDGQTHEVELELGPST
jgi:cyclic beta-1,2-glucan synthetase